MIRFFNKSILDRLNAFLKVVVCTCGLAGLSSGSAAELDVSKLDVGKVASVEWHGLPVFVYKRTPADIASLKLLGESNPGAMDQGFFQWHARASGNWQASAIKYGESIIQESELRSLRDDVFVVLGVSANFGCGLQLAKAGALFEDPCSHAQYDNAGRIRNPNARERYNLLVPPHLYHGDVLMIGEQADDLVIEEDFSPNIDALKISDGAKVVEAIQWHKLKLALKYARRDGAKEYETAAGASALHVAAAKGTPALVSALLSLGFELDKLTKDGQSPLYFALLAGKEDNAIVLMARGAKTEAFCSGNRCAQSAESFLKSRRSNLSAESADKFISRLKASAKLSKEVKNAP